MRVDKYLKVARILKKRPISKDLAIQERLFVNNRKAKPATDIKENDIITIIFGNKMIELRVISLLKQASKSQALEMYEIIKDKIMQDKIDDNKL